MDARRTGFRIKECRRRRNMTQNQLAERLQVNPMTISCWERGRYKPSDAYLADIAGILNVPKAYLIGDPDDADKKNALTEIDESDRPNYVLHYVQTPDEIFNVPILPNELPDLSNPELIPLRDRDAVGFIPWPRKNFINFNPNNPPFALEVPSMPSMGVANDDIAIVNPAEMPIQGSLVLISRSLLWGLAFYYELPNNQIMIQNDSSVEIISVDSSRYKNFELIAPVVGIVRTKIRRRYLHRDLTPKKPEEPEETT